MEIDDVAVELSLSVVFRLPAMVRASAMMVMPPVLVIMSLTVNAPVLVMLNSPTMAVTAEISVSISSTSVPNLAIEPVERSWRVSVPGCWL